MNPLRPRIISARYLAEGESLPRWYGIAWWLPNEHAAYCLPVPLNRLVGAFRNWWLTWRLPVENDPILQAYQDGERAGCVKAIRHAKHVIREELGSIH